MPGRRGKLILAGCAAVVALLLAGCGDEGGSDEIPQPAADEMLSLIDEIEQANADQDCETAQSTTTDLRNRVDALENSGTTDALNEMIDRLDENLDDECPPGLTSPDAEAEEPAPVEPVDPVEPAPEEEAPPEEEEPEEGGPPEQPSGEGGGQGPPQTPPGQSGGGGSSEPPTGGTEGED